MKESAKDLVQELRRVAAGCENHSRLNGILLRAAIQIDDLRLNAPEPISITRTEGGQFVPFIRGLGGEVHSIHFSDGSVFDACNGWRPERAWQKPRVRIPAGRAAA